MPPCLCHMSQNVTHRFEDHDIEKNPAKVAPKHRKLAEFQNDLDTELGKAFATNLHLYDHVYVFVQLTGMNAEILAALAIIFRRLPASIQLLQALALITRMPISTSFKPKETYCIC